MHNLSWWFDVRLEGHRITKRKRPETVGTVSGR
jgi:hypothetical protein